jgi:hypothetical protein
MRRLENKTFAEIATHLNRDTESIKMRFEKVVQQQIEDGADKTEALRWFNLSTE